MNHTTQRLASRPPATARRPPNPINEASLTSRARTALRQAAAAAGFNLEGARTLQLHRNWVVRLPHAAPGRPVVAKVHEPRPTPTAVHREVQVAAWLHRSGVLTARPVVERPTATETGLLVTFTEDLGDGPPASFKGLGRLLAELHALPLPSHIALPALDVTGTLLSRISRLPEDVLAPADVHWLSIHVSAAGEQWKNTPCGGDVVLHGDLNVLNSIVTPAGPALIDFETVSRGPAAYDLAFEAWRRDGFGEDPAGYARFCHAYGADVTTDRQGAPYKVLARLRAATGAVIALEAAVHDPAWRPEAARRLNCVRTLNSNPARHPWNWSTDPTVPAAEAASTRARTA
ncbi:aminoglycoside phosphotransferase family protein [Kitasatospora sp. NPDC088160]|uniref:aminoglycoside phosphotransferase family protein n=1 Tax=Kitasatospora sp. NPDC088160 TaxID=3364072 RepID=UPI00381EBD80